jgi:hypothetical protein
LAKGNDGNYFQHSVEAAVAFHLAKQHAQGSIHIALAHGMAPFEPCDEPPKGQARRLLWSALDAAQRPPVPGEASIVAAYRATKASLKQYPNSGEILAAIIGRGRLSGGITEIVPRKYAELVVAWAGSDVTPVNSSWRREVLPGGVLSCPVALHTPWLVAADPMTFQEEGYADDEKLYRQDLSRLSAALRGFVATGQPGVAALFVYSVRPHVRQQFWDFAFELACISETALVSCWATHQGGKRNLVGLLCSRVALPASWLPQGVQLGK